MVDITYAEGLAESLPVCGDSPDGRDLISLCDIVVTGIDTDWIHFMVHEYNSDADGVLVPWAVLEPLGSAGTRDDGSPYKPKVLWATAVRQGVKDYLQARLNAGMTPAEAAKMVDGSYTDAVVADSILQFIVYGEEVYG